MRKFLALVLSLVLAASCGGQHDPDDPAPVGSSFVKGADISSVTEMESKGYKFYNKSGQERDLFALMKEIGFDAVRLRVWVNPTGGWSGRDDVVAKARRAQAQGLKVMVDFHYSDYWADPGKQNVPLAWKGKDATAMAAAVRDHTRDVLQALKIAGVDVAWVQVGNEVTGGMLWDSGKVSGTSMGHFVKYFDAGREAVKAVYPDAKVILHLDNGWNLGTLNWFLTLAKGQSLQYDILAKHQGLKRRFRENGDRQHGNHRPHNELSNLHLLISFLLSRPTWACRRIL